MYGNLFVLGFFLLESEFFQWFPYCSVHIIGDATHNHDTKVKPFDRV